MRLTAVLEIPTAEQEALLRDCAKPVMGIYSLFTFALVCRLSRDFGDVHYKCAPTILGGVFEHWGDVEEHLAENSRGIKDCQRSTTLRKWI